LSFSIDGDSSCALVVLTAADVDLDVHVAADVAAAVAAAVAFVVPVLLANCWNRRRLKW